MTAPARAQPVTSSSPSSPPSGGLPTTSSSPRSGVSAPQATSEAFCALSSRQPSSLSQVDDPADEAPATPQSLDPSNPALQSITQEHQP